MLQSTLRVDSGSYCGKGISTPVTCAMILSLILALIGYTVGCAYALWLLVGDRLGSGRPVTIPVLTGFFFHTVSLAAVCVVQGGWPVGAPAESFSFISWAVVLLACLAVWRYSAPSLLAFALPLAALTGLLALLLAVQPEGLAGLEEVPTGPWLWAHIALSLLAVAALLLAALAGVAYLLQERQLKSRHPGPLMSRLPALEVCDRLGYRSLLVGFGLLTAGFLMGAIGIWSALGGGWSWDPTRILAFSAWGIYLAVLSWRWAVGLRGRKAAYLTIAGSLSVTAILLGVLLVSGRFHPGG